jgi:hypothetical protein
VTRNYRGLYRFGNKEAAQFPAIQVLDCRNWSLARLRLAEYRKSEIGPDYRSLPWETDVIPTAATPKPR